jgi:hypothetical protein
MKQLRNKYRKIVRCLGFVGLAIVLLNCAVNAQRSATAVSTIRVTLVSPSNDMSVNKNLLSHLTQINNPESDENATLTPNDLPYQRLTNINNGEDIASMNLDGKLGTRFIDMWMNQDRNTQGILDEKGILYLCLFDPLGSPQFEMTGDDTTLTIVSVLD